MVQIGSSHEYELLKIDDHEETINASGVYTVIRRKSNKTTGKQIHYIIALTVKITARRPFEIHTWIAKSLCTDSNKNQKVLYLILISN